MNASISLEQRCREEVEQLHHFFQGWFSGRLANTDDAFDRFARVLVSEFQMISADGTFFTSREELLAGIRSLHGRWQDYLIRVEDVSVRRLRDDLCMVTYVEWQRVDGQTSRRTSSAMMVEDDSSPNGVVWLHLHETWRPGEHPSASSADSAPEAPLVARFEGGDITPAEMTHTLHVQLAWHYVREYGLVQALDRFSSALRQFAAAHDKGDLYHETITWAYMLLVNERIARADSEHTWEQFARANSDIMARGKRVLDRYYSSERLWSDIARSHFILPDRMIATDEA